MKRADGVNWRCGVSGSVWPQSEENHPVLHVSWNDAVAYCKWLSAKTGKRFRLPTAGGQTFGAKKPLITGTACLQLSAR
ncbi:formylglycine-generating enzyme family protein [Pelodictyon phaeoclathratiforme]|uniref:formylglycine-generating enzyme family protein n=1 Tax=Pelodictyon phaeoclathratiforme TaxID=34090 RepID=UPI0000541ED6